MDCPIPHARGMLRPEGTGSCGVMILGESMGDQEVEEGLPFRPSAQAGSVLERAIRRAGFRREMFSVWNVLPCQPPNNKINKKWESAAIEWGRSYLEEQIDRFQPRCILALGNTAIRATTGLTGDKLGVHQLAGYILPGIKSTYPPVVASFHPSYLRRGAMSLLGVVMRTIKLALMVAQGSRVLTLPPVDAPPLGYILHPTEAQVAEFLYTVQHLTPEAWLAYDIETYYSTAEEEAEEHDAKDIRSIQFSIGRHSGIFIPWRQPYLDTIRRILETRCKKIGWNNWRFDDPALRSSGLTINGEIHDLMWTWHHLQPDLPRGLQFACSMQGRDIFNPSHCWPWPWKHLDRANPQFYGIVDVDTLQWMVTYQ